MRRCVKCGVDVRGTGKTCPLCASELAENRSAQEEKRDAEGDIFPRIPSAKRHKTFYSWMAFIAITASVICVAINMSVPTSGLQEQAPHWWSLFVIAGMGSLCLSLSFAIKTHKNIPKTILWQVALISALAYLWDKFTGNAGWSTDYVLPILCTAALVAMAVVARAMKLDIRDYMIYLIIDSLLGVLSFILMLINYLDVVYPSAICFASSVISIAALIFFEGKSLWTEIQRRMHF